MAVKAIGSHLFDSANKNLWNVRMKADKKMHAMKVPIKNWDGVEFSVSGL
jgi:hypothetical protein